MEEVFPYYCTSENHSSILTNIIKVSGCGQDKFEDGRRDMFEPTKSSLMLNAVIKGALLECLAFHAHSVGIISVADLVSQSQRIMES